jgi:hypothetical protein
MPLLPPIALVALAEQINSQSQQWKSPRRDRRAEYRRPAPPKQNILIFLTTEFISTNRRDPFLQPFSNPNLHTSSPSYQQSTVTMVRQFFVGGNFKMSVHHSFADIYSN